MHLDGDDADAELIGNVFVGEPFGGEAEDFLFARGERREKLALTFFFGGFLKFAGGCCDRFFHGFHEPHRIAVFFNEVDGPVRQCPYGRRHVAVSGEKNDGKRGAAVFQGLLDFESRHAGHTKIKYEAARALRVVLRQKFTGIGPVLEFPAEA